MIGGACFQCVKADLSTTTYSLGRKYFTEQESMHDIAQPPDTLNVQGGEVSFQHYV